MIKKQLTESRQEQLCYDLANALGFAGGRVNETNIHWGNTRPMETVWTMDIIIKPNNYHIRLFDKRRILRQHPYKGTHTAHLKGDEIHIQTNTNGYEQYLIIKNGTIIYNH